MDDWTSYDRVAATYGRVHDPRFAEPARDLVELAQIEAGSLVLDIGTGTGATAAAVTGAGAIAVGADPSVPMLAQARGARPDLHLVAAHGIDLPFLDRTFDGVTGGFVLAHFTNVETALYELRRVTRSGGRLAFSAWADGDDAFIEAWLELVYGVVPREMLEPSLARAIPNQRRFRSADIVEQTMYDAGLRRIRTERTHYEWTYARDDLVEGLGVWAVGRFVRAMVGDGAWPAFLERAKAVFAERFPDPVHDRRDVVLAVGTTE